MVIGLDSITGLQTARILADRGVPVYGIVADRHHWGAMTNTCVEVVQSPLAGPELVSTLRTLGLRLPGRGVLLPCTDSSVETLSRDRAQLSQLWTLPLSDDSTVRLLLDKTSFARHARANGLPTPRTEELHDRAQAMRISAGIEYPCVIKPPCKSPIWLAHTAAKAFVVRDADDFLSTYDRVSSWSSVLLVQEWVEGAETELYSCNAYFGEGGRPLATFVARKVRQWPPRTGTSASGEECRNDEVLDCTLRLFGGLGFRGLAYLEMKRDVRTGRLVIIEPNVGRPTGRSAIAEAGGVDLVYTAYCDATGLPLPPARTQRYAEARWVDDRRDLQAAAVAWRDGTLTLGEWVRWMRGPKAHAIWSARDRKPFLIDMVRAGATGVRRLRARHPIPADAAIARQSRRRDIAVGETTAGAELTDSMTGVGS